MRLSSLQIYHRGLDGIARATSALQQSQEQIASSRRWSSPAQDPVAAARSLELEASLRSSEQYQRNIDRLEGRMNVVETQLDNIETAVDRLRELLIQAGSGALSNAEREHIVVEMEAQIAAITSWINSRDEVGDYIFSGFKSGAQPFVVSGERFVYQGDDGVRFESVSDDLQLASNETGRTLFGDIRLDRQLISASAAEGNLTAVQLTTAEITDQALFEISFDGDYSIVFNPLDYAFPASPNYSIRRLDDGELIAVNQPFSLSQSIDFNGVSLSLDRLPVPGDVLLVSASEQQDILTTLSAVASQLGSFSDSAERQAFIEQSLSDLSAIQSHLRLGRSRVGARLNTLQAVRSSQQSLDIIQQGALSRLRDIDYAEAVGELSLQQFVLEAAQQSFARVAKLSLFQFLR